MDLKEMMRFLEENAEKTAGMFRGVSQVQACWKPAPENWSMLEVINHLYDEERFDFRVRLDYILYRPEEPWPLIDPKGWVNQRQYNKRDLSVSLSNFLAERKASLRWLKSLINVDWDKAVQETWGTLRAGDMLSAWVGHDVLHLRQLIELQWAYQLKRAEPYHVEYAGKW